MKSLFALSIAILMLLPQEKPPAVVGWRGDGSGRYPTARPPTQWSRVSRAVQSLRFQADKPRASDTGTPMPDGVVREWLVAVSPADPVDDAALEPDSTWKKVRFETAWLDFNTVLGKSGKGMAYAATHIHSETGGPFRLNATQLAGFKIVLNGKAITPGYGRTNLELAKGWNRILLKVAPRDADWACSFVLHARAPAVFDETGIAWRLPLPGVTGGFYGGGTGVGSPVIVQDRLYLQSEPGDLVCVNKVDGRVLWVRTNNFVEAATEADRKHPAFAEAEAFARTLEKINASLSDGPLPPKKLEEKAAAEAGLSAKMQAVDAVRYKKWETPDVGFSGLTPVTDGKSIYVWFANGITACYDLAGKRRWIRADVLPAIEHGFSSSPALIGGKIILFMRDLIAIDAASGKLAWQIPLVSHEGANPQGYFHGTPTGIVVGGVTLIALANGTIVRASDGKILFSHVQMGNQAISSPVVEGNQLLQLNTWGMQLFIHTLPAVASEPLKMSTRIVSIDTPRFPKYYVHWHMASPLVHQGLAYFVNNNGVLTVVDLEAAKVVEQRMLDIDHFQTANEGSARGVGISPSLAGGRLYLFGNNGGAVVLEPRTLKQIAKNKIESLVSVGHWGERQERFVSNPVFDGDRLYLRGEGHLYALKAGGTSTVRTAESPTIARPTPAPVAAPIVPVSGDPEVLPPTVVGWRRNGTGQFPGTTPPTEWSGKKNIRWQTTVGAGHSSPVVSGEKIFIVAEPGTLHCLARADGKPVWKASLHDDLPPEIKVQEPPGTRERARPTPVTDGKHVYVSLCDGLVACYSVDGRRAWVRRIDPPALTYGPSASPVLVGDRLLVESKRLTALEASTGRTLWTAAEGEAHYGTPAVFALGSALLAVTGKGTVIRISDGEVLAKDIAPGLGGDQAPTPVVQGGVVYFAYRRCSAVKLSLVDGRLKSESLWEQELPGDVIASPLLKDGMLFVVTSGSADYRVLNALTGAVLLEKGLDLSPNLYPSLTLAGTYLYLGNDQGESLVLEASREYRQVRQNVLPEGSGASPAFAGAHLFLRGGAILYCIGP